jgi:hypothetical protein
MIAGGPDVGTLERGNRGHRPSRVE